MVLVIPPSQHSQRLDQALALLLPNASRRARMRCIEQGRVLLNGKPAAKGTLVQAGQTLELLDLPQTEPQHRIEILAMNERFAALLKPAGMHSAALAQSEGTSLEDALPDLFPDKLPVLLNRLDQPTSGIILAGLTTEAVEHYSLLQDQGLVDKRYLAVLQAQLEEECIVDKALDTAKRSKTRVLPYKATPLRCTRLRPLQHMERDGQSLTLVEAHIKKGARHQIRAHCAFLGAPILGDELYGKKKQQNQPQATGLHLHHARLHLPEFQARSLPQWLDEWPKASELV